MIPAQQQRHGNPGPTHVAFDSDENTASEPKNCSVISHADGLFVGVRCSHQQSKSYSYLVIKWCFGQAQKTFLIVSTVLRRFLDEIALLKRGKITRDTPKHTYKRGLSAEDANAPPVVRK
ncbi:hypothetical protein ANCDUO_23129 [Ancylostoma duodenale]|uniref:Uncharacterized protein n=1 Tax=Ancylostoma duodenale TaxID=51022 RepID=A0A0C2FJ67_9BILA|nr:hypothetical protein ANCDUO_23129 [Ancylostoma duodenale]